VWWVRQAVLKALAEQTRSVRIPLNQNSQLIKLSRAETVLAQVLKRDPTDTELGRLLEESPDQVRSAKQMSATEMSLDAPVDRSDREASTLGERFAGADGMEIEGIIQRIDVDEGDVVAQGDVVASLADRDLRAELVKTRAEIEEKRARLNLLRAGARSEEIEVARTLVAKGEERVKYAQSRAEMDDLLFRDKLVSRKDLEDSKEQLAVRQKELQEATDRLNVLLAGSRKEEIQATEAEIRRLEAHQQYLEEQLRLLNVVSPISGVITTRKLRDKLGEAVKKGDLIAKVHAMQSITVEIAVPEKEIAEVTVNQKVVLKAQAWPQLSFEGVVTAIAPVATAPATPRGETTVRVITQLDNHRLLLKPDMTGHAKIYCGERRLIDLLTRRFVRFFKVEFWSWW